MKCALVGCGRIAVNHIKAIINNDLDLVATCDLVSKNIDILFQKTGYKNNIDRYTNYQELLKVHPDIDFVSIATDSGVHAEIALYFINHGINVIIEKPMAMSISDAEEIIMRSEKNSVKVSVCHQNRFNLAVQEMKKAVEQGRFGKISHGSVNIRWNRNLAYYMQAPWRGKWASDGGALMNQCIHGIDLLRWLMGDKVDEVYGVTRQQYHNYLECEDVGMAVVKFTNGAIGTIEGTVNVYPKNLEETLYFFGETGTVKLGGTSCNNIDVWDFENYNEDDKKRIGMTEVTSNVYGNGHTSLYADYIDALICDRKPYVDAMAGKNALEIVLAVYKSQLTGLPVSLPLKDFSTINMKGIFGEGTL